MSVITRCVRCGREYTADRRAIVAGTWRLCPACRGPEPPSGGELAGDEGMVLPSAPEAAP